MKGPVRYAKSGDVHIAYRIFGDGPRDIVLIPGTISHVELLWELPSFERLLKRLTAFRGREIDRAGDGPFATFDGPARGIRCACSARARLRSLGLRVRIGLHTGECELVGDSVRGIAVHIGARVAARAGADAVLVSSTVKDLVAGSGLEFADRGMHVLKRVPDEWRPYSVA